MEVELIMLKSDGNRRVFPLKPGATVVGRTNEADLRVPLPSVSRRHCEVTVDGDVVRVRDLGSSNGTMHNNQRVDEAVLAAGDHIGLGPVSFLVRINGEPPESAEVGPAAAPAAADAPTAAEEPLPVTEPEPEPQLVEPQVAEAVAVPYAPPAAAQPVVAARAPASAPAKPQVIQVESEMPSRVVPEHDSPTADLDDPISALERLATEQAAMEELAYFVAENKSKDKKKGKR